VLTHLRKRRVAMRRSTSKIPGDQLVAAAERYRAGETLTAIAADLGVHRKTLKRNLERIKVEIRPKAWNSHEDQT
jgi:hypothetical protein